MSSPKLLTSSDFTKLLAFRDGLRRFLRWSEEEASAVGLTGAQHQLLLAIRGHGQPPSISEIAHHLLLRHNSAVELVDRAVAAGLIERVDDVDDHRVVRLTLTETGIARLAALTGAHLEELSRLRTHLAALWDDLPTPAA